MASNNEFECVFRHCDVDGDGKISPKELQHCVKMIYGGGDISEEDVEEMIKSSDSDGDGLLGMDDLSELVKSDGEEDEEKIKDLKEAFGMYAMEGCDGITPWSLKTMLGRLGESKTVEECRVMIGKFDLDGDGVLSFDEFMVMMQ